MLKTTQLLRELIAGGFRGTGDSLYAKLEIIRIAGIFNRRLVGDQTLLQQIVERLIKGLHAILRRSLLQRFLDVARLLRRGNTLANICRGD